MDQELFGRVPSVPPLALRVWLYFEIECEKDDRAKPGFWSPHEPDCWIPTGSRAPMVAFARQLRDRINEFCHRKNIREDDSREAQIIVNRMTFTQQVKLAEELDREIGETFSLDPKAEFQGETP